MRPTDILPPMSHRIFSVPFADIYPHYVKKVERKGRTVSELYEVITWLTGYSVEGLERVRKQEVPSRISSSRPHT